MAPGSSLAVFSLAVFAPVCLVVPVALRSLREQEADPWKWFQGTEPEDQPSAEGEERHREKRDAVEPKDGTQMPDPNPLPTAPASGVEKAARLPVHFAMPSGAERRA
jgi:hypothetical protein